MLEESIDPKTAKFRQLCADHKLSPTDVCTMTGRGLSIVHHWMSGKYKKIPGHMLELLELKIANGQQSSTKG